MPHVLIRCAPEDRRITMSYMNRCEIEETFERILGSIVPEGLFASVQFYPRHGEDILEVVYSGILLTHVHAEQMIRDAALIAKVGDYDWDREHLDIFISPRRQTAHEAIEQTAELQKIRRRA
jgi:hypothetical protein